MTTIELNLNSNPTCAADEQVRNQATAVTKEAAVRLIERLVEQRANWETTAYKTSNDMLYGVLQGCYAFYKTMCGAGAEAKAARDGFEQYLSENKLAFTKSTHTIAKIVRSVFGSDRRRVSAYSIVLRRAFADKVAPIDFANFIKNAGGVEEIRLAKSSALKSPKQKAEEAESRIGADSLGTIKTDAIAQRLDPAKTGERIVLIATQAAEGELIINAVINTEAALKAALSSYYSQNKKTWQAESSQAEIKSKTDQMIDAVNSAVEKQLAA